MSNSAISEGSIVGPQLVGNSSTEVSAPQPNREAPVSRGSSGGESRKIDVAVETALREPIQSLANKAKSDRESSLESIEGVAEDIEDAIEILNATLEKAPTRAIISRDEQLNRFIVKIADERSGEIVREIPSEAVLRFARNLQEIKGLLFDKAL